LIKAFVTGSTLVSLMGIIQITQVYMVPFEFIIFIIPIIIGGLSGVFFYFSELKQKLSFKN
jgi:hypothetical protein